MLKNPARHPLFANTTLWNIQVLLPLSVSASCIEKAMEHFTVAAADPARTAESREATA